MKQLLAAILVFGIGHSALAAEEKDSTRDKCCQTVENRFLPIQFSDEKLKCVKEDEKGKRGKLVDQKFCQTVCCKKRRAYISDITFGECEDIGGDKADYAYCELENVDKAKVCCRQDDGRHMIVPKNQCIVRNLEEPEVCYRELVFVCCQMTSDAKKGDGFAGYYVERLTECKALLPPGTPAKDTDLCSSDPNFDLIGKITRESM